MRAFCPILLTVSSIDNWQSILQKQYAKRALDLNPSSAELISLTEDKTLAQAGLITLASSQSVDTDRAARTESASSKNDWLRLPMLQKLDSMHLLTEWQFQHPMRLRTLMKNDDENASWVSRWINNIQSC